MEAAALRLLGAGANKLPAVVADRRLFAGELRLAEAAAALRAVPRGAERGIPA